MLLRFFFPLVVVVCVSGCFDFDKAYCTGFCDGGVTGGSGGGNGGAGGGAGGGAAGGGGGAVSDAGEDDAGLPDAGAPDAGAVDAGEMDAGAVDAGLPDAGCGGAVQLVIVAPPSFLPDVCSPTVKVQLHDACGAPVITPNSVPVTITTSSPTMTLNNDGSCSNAPFSWAIGAGTSELELYAQDSTPGMPTLTASAAGLDAGVEALTIGCPSGQRVCPGVACVPATGGCCSDADCTAGGLPWVCNNSHVCEPPPCSFPASCTIPMYVDRTAAGASRTVTFDSSGYAPKCMRVTGTQDVTFSGSFGIHPLQQTCGPNRQMTTTTGVTKVVRFPQFGEYGYRCANHPVFEQGAIRVQ